MPSLFRWTTIALITRLCIACGSHPDDRPPLMAPAPNEQEEAIDLDVMPDNWVDFFAQPEDCQDPSHALSDCELGQSTAAATAGGVRAVGGDGKWCLTADKTVESGSPIRLKACNGSDEQSFRLDGTALKVLANRCVRPGHGNHDDGAILRLYACDADKTSQSWRRDGQLLRWSSSDKCLDVVDGEFQDGTQLQIWTCDATNRNQQFSFGSTPSAPVATPPAVSHGKRIDLTAWNQAVIKKGTFNNEEQRYTNGNRNVSFAADGTATIRAFKDSNGEWTSARMTGDEVGSLPAYYEATITLPSGKGTWPAFWLTAKGAWPQGGEIDIMEQVNGDGKTHWSNHWGAHSGKPTFNTHESMGGLDLSKPHRYGGYITAKGVQFYVDGKAVGKWVTYPAESNFPKIASQMVPIVNLAMGGNWPGHIPSSTGPQTMIVHSVTKSLGPPQL